MINRWKIDINQSKYNDSWLRDTGVHYLTLVCTCYGLNEYDYYDDAESLDIDDLFRTSYTISDLESIYICGIVEI